MVTVLKFNIKICEYCSGEGSIDTDFVTDYHKSEYRTETSECPECLGSGRIREQTTITKEPFVPRRNNTK